MKIGADINQALSALDRQIQLASNTAGLAVYNDKKERAAAEDSEANGEVDGVAEVDDDSPLGKNLDVEA